MVDIACPQCGHKTLTVDHSPVERMELVPIKGGYVKNAPPQPVIRVRPTVMCWTCEYAEEVQ